MTDNTKQKADQSLFIYVKDLITNKVKKLVIPSDVQIGLFDNPVELLLTGRFSFATKDYVTTGENKAILHVSNNDTIISVILDIVPINNRVTIKLPATPRNGQIHFIKDQSGTADTIPIDIVPADGVLIDDASVKTLSDKHGSLAIYWSKGQWRILVSGVGLGGIGGAPNDATYITLSGNSSLSNERRLDLTGSNVVMTDNGANSNVYLDLTQKPGVNGTYTYSTVTVDNFGRITAASNGSPPTPSNASYITVTNEPSLTDERALVVSTGLSGSDGGPEGSYTLTIDNNIVATITGSTFTGPVVAQSGLSGSLQQLSSGESYLVAGTNVSIVSSSNGQIVISSTGGTFTGTISYGGDPYAPYLTLATTSSLYNERVLVVSGTSGLLLDDSGPNGNASLSINDNIVATISGSTFTGPVKALSGFTGSLFYTNDNLSYLVAGTNVLIVSSSNGQITISSIGGSSSGGGDPDASYIVLSTTSSLSNERVLTVSGTSGLLLDDSGSGFGVSLSINDNIVATISGSTFTGPIVAQSGLSGSLQQLSSGESYLVAGTNVSIVSSSNGQIIISSIGGSSDAGDPYASYLVLSTTSSLYNERVLVVSGTSGLLLNDSGPDGNASISINDNVVATISGSAFTGPIKALAGFTGSLFYTNDNLSYLVAGTNVSIVSSSNGQIVISSATPSTSSGGGGGDPDASYLVLSTTSSLSNERVLTAGTGIAIVDNGPGSTLVISSTITPNNVYNWIDGNNKLKTTSSVAVSGVSDVYCDAIGTDVQFYVSGTIDITTASLPTQSRVSVFGGDVVVSGSLKIGSGSIKITSNAVQWGEEQTRLERHNNDLRFFDNNNPTGYTLTQLAAIGGGGSGDPYASYVVLSTTSSLSNERVLVVSGTSGLLLDDSGPNGNASLTIDNNIVATISGSTFTGPVVAQSGLSGSLQQLSSGESYLVAGTNVSIVSSSNGQITISSTGGSSSSGGDPDASYLVLSTTASLSSERVLTAGTGISIIDNGPGSTFVINSTSIPGGSSFPRFESLSIVSSRISAYTEVFEDIGAFEFNTSGVDSMIPSGSTSYTAHFQPIVEVYPYGIILETRLYNVTTDSVVSNSLMSSSSVIPERLKSLDLSGSLSPTGNNIYTIQLRLQTALTDARATCKGAKLFVTWS